MHYDLMKELWATNCATSHGVRTARQVWHHIHRQVFIVDLNDYNMEYIKGTYIWCCTWVTFSITTAYGFIKSPSTTQYASSSNTSSSRVSKRKTSMVDVMDAQFDKLTTKLDVLIDTIGTWNVKTEKLSSIAEIQVMASKVIIMAAKKQVQYSERQVFGNWIAKWTYWWTG